MNGRVRLAGAGAIAGGLLWSAAIVVQQAGSYLEPRSGAGFFVVQAIVLLACAGFLVGVQGLDWARAVGAGRFGRWSVRAFEVGIALEILASAMILATRSDESPLFPLGGVVMAVAGVLTGVAAIRAAVLTGWQRLAALLVGLYFLLGMVVPTIFVPGDAGPPPVLEIVWGATGLLLGLALLTASPAPPVAARAPGLTGTEG